MKVWNLKRINTSVEKNKIKLNTSIDKEYKKVYLNQT